MADVPATEADESPVTSGCPIDHRSMTAALAGSSAGLCPVPPGAGQRSAADLVVRKVLRIRDRPTGLSENAAYSAFQRSMLISAIRCTLTYVIFPFVLPAAGFATGVGPVLGIAIGLVAITCDVFTIRRFFSVDHRWRWQFSAIAGTVICLLLILMVQDIVHLLR
jgi:hypothetical protein